MEGQIFMIYAEVAEKAKRYSGMLDLNFDEFAEQAILYNHYVPHRFDKPVKAHQVKSRKVISFIQKSRTKYAHPNKRLNGYLMGYISSFEPKKPIEVNTKTFGVPKELKNQLSEAAFRNGQKTIDYVGELVSSGYYIKGLYSFRSDYTTVRVDRLTFDKVKKMSVEKKRPIWHILTGLLEGEKAKLLLE